MDPAEQKALSEAVAQVRHLETQHKAASQILRSRVGPLEGSGFLEPLLTYKVPNSAVKGRVAAVDGGVISRELHGLDVILSRAVGAAFDYDGGSKVRTTYFPRARPPYTLRWRSALETHEANVFKGLARLQDELTCTVNTLESLAPDAMLMDGSIVPQASDKPNKDSPLADVYDAVIERYRTLFSTAEKRGTLLLGVIKDSRGSRFSELLMSNVPELSEYRSSLSKAHDSLFLASLLQEGERTCFFRYSGTNSEQPLAIKDLKEWSFRIASTYLRPSPYDRPLRVDALMPPRESNLDEFFTRAATLVHNLARINTRYAMPAVLIEADLRARAEERDMEVACATLSSRLGVRPTLFPLRRDSRPFG